MNMQRLPMKETDADIAERNRIYDNAKAELRQLIEQYEQLEAEKKDVTGQQKELMAEAKARGYDTKVMRKVVALCKRNRDDVAEEDAIMALYLAALGMSDARPSLEGVAAQADHSGL